jgi:hypothetical protein
VSQLDRHAPATHLYGTQLVSVPSVSFTVYGSLHVAATPPHCPVCTLHSAPVAQSAFVLHVVLQFAVAVSHA